MILISNIFPYSNKNTRGLLIHISHYGNIKGKVPLKTCHEGIQEVQVQLYSFFNLSAG